MHGIELAFAIIGVVGLVTLIFSFIAGEAGGHLDFGGHVEIGGGHVEIGSHPDIGGHADINSDGPSIFSLSVLGASLVGFGAFGYVAVNEGFSGAGAVVSAAVGFFALAVSAFFGVLKPLARQQYNASLGRSSFRGCLGKVILPITREEPGLVEFIDRNNARVTERAVSDEELPKGASIVIYDTEPGFVHVMPSPPELQ